MALHNEFQFIRIGLILLIWAVQICRNAEIVTVFLKPVFV